MPVEVISEQAERFGEVLCAKCRYRLRYTPLDVQKNDYTDISGCAETYFWIRCPKCGAMVAVRQPQ